MAASQRCCVLSCSGDGEFDVTGAQLNFAKSAGGGSSRTASLWNATSLPMPSSRRRREPFRSWPSPTRRRLSMTATKKGATKKATAVTMRAVSPAAVPARRLRRRIQRPKAAPRDRRARRDCGLRQAVTHGMANHHLRGSERGVENHRPRHGRDRRGRGRARRGDRAAPPVRPSRFIEESSPDRTWRYGAGSHDQTPPVWAFPCLSKAKPGVTEKHGTLRSR